MNLNELLLSRKIDPHNVLVFRHRPHEPELNKVLPWLAAERHDLFNAYQQTQNKMLEGRMKKMEGAGYVASFIRRGPRKALFVGLYSIVGSRPLTRREFWQIPAFQQLHAHGMEGWSPKETRRVVQWFDLKLTDIYGDWKGKLVVKWPPPELSWWRRAHRNKMDVLAILEDNDLDAVMPEWNDLDLTWEQLGVLPSRWKSALRQWRGIYYIFDKSDRKAYVGSAYGQQNILGRWEDYAASGDGGNQLLKGRDPHNFRFSILERVSPDMDAGDVIRLESSWKERLHTRKPHGLNKN